MRPRFQTTAINATPLMTCKACIPVMAKTTAPNTSLEGDKSDSCREGNKPHSNIITPSIKTRPKTAVTTKPRINILRSPCSIPVSAKFIEKLLIKSTVVTMKPTH